MTQIMDRQMGLTDEITKKLSVPVPSSEIQVKKQGGAEIRFTSDKFVMRRLDEVVGSGGWEDNYVAVSYAKPPTKTVGSGDKKREVSFLGVVTCHLTVLGTTKSGEADLEFDPTMYGTPATNAQARAFKRAAMKFGIGWELWDKEHAASGDDDESPRAKSSYSGNNNRTSTSSSNSGKKGLSDGQIAWLTKAIEKGGFGVPMAVVEGLTPGREGTGSALIEALKFERARDVDEYEENSREIIRGYLAKSYTLDGQKFKAIAPELAHLLDAGDADDEDLD